MPQNYSSWSLEKLKKERLKIDKAISLAEKRDKKATLQKMAAIARQNGFELHELMTTTGTGQFGKSEARTRPTKRKSAPRRAKVAPKYQNPNDSTQTWTGRGRQPLWVKDLLDNGATLTDLMIVAIPSDS